MKKTICFVLFLMITICCIGCGIDPKKDLKVVLNIMETDNTTNKSRIFETTNVENEDIIKLSDRQFYLCNRKPNDITIISIEDDYVKISRTKLSYHTSNGDKKYTEEVVEEIKYNEPFSVSINETNPIAGACQQPKYSYYLEFQKQ